MRSLSALLVLLLCALVPFEAGAAQRTASGATVTARPLIDQVRGRTVRVRVPGGITSVTLERCTSARQARWEIVATKATGPAAGTVEFQLPQAVSRRFLRVKGSVAPAATGALVGARLFLADPALTGGGVFASNGVEKTLNTGVLALNSDSAGAAPDVTRAVSESDIWRVAGDRLYFFNELRGLQIFDIANPDDPALLGQLRAPGRGEQMYLLDATHVALLVRGSDNVVLPVRFFAAGAPSDANLGAVVVVNVAAGRPVEVARVSYRGSLRESRRVGSVLYVVSEVWNGGAGELEVSSFDLSDPARPVARGTVTIAGWGNVIHATDRFLFVVSHSDDWSRSFIDLIDITSPTGVMAQRGRIQTAGRVEDKFKLHLDGDTLTAVSAIPRTWSGNEWGAAVSTAPRTKIETFSLTNPDAPAALGSIVVGEGETVRATRFDDKRLYVVTFFQIDPLWVIDLTNPATPTLLGELEIPGFSTYIEPLGDRLVAVGRLDDQTAVSLFDVSDPTRPVALSQLALGDGSSWSEANWDEKAFNVLPDENLIVVPFSGYEAGSGYASRVQLIDLTRNGLVKRGVIDHGLAARRTAVKGNRLLAISSTDLVTVNIANRDQPTVTSEVEIAWRVDRVFLAGNYLLQVGGSANWRQQQPQNISVSTASDPDTALTTVALDDATVLGATVRDGRLYIAQRNPGWYSNLVLYAANSGTGAATPSGNPFILSVFDLTSLPALPRLARTESEVDLGYVTELDAAWPSPGVLVWVRTAQRYYWPLYDSPVIRLPSVTPLVVAGNATGTLNVSGATLTLGGNSSTFVTYGDTTASGATFTVNVGAVSSIAAPIVLAGSQTWTSAGSSTVNVVPVGSAGTLTTLGQNPNTTPPPPPAGAAISIPSFLSQFSGEGTVALSAASSGRVARRAGASDTRVLPATSTAIAGTNTSSSGATVSAGASVGTISAGSLRVSAASSASLSIMPWWGNGNGGHEALVFDVSAPTAPVLAAKLSIRTGSTGDWSEPSAAGGKLYVSSMAYEDFVTIGDKTDVSLNAPSRRYRHFLKVVDLANPATPVISADINIPGRLIGLSNAGARLYTVGCRYEADGAPTHSRALHVSTFDGTAANFVDQLALADYGTAHALDLDTVLLGVRETVSQPNRVEAWQLDGTTAKFQRLSQTTVNDVDALGVVRGILVVGSTYGPRQLFDVTDAVNVRALGTFPASPYYWSAGNLDKADGTPTRGLWQPLGNYGVEFVIFAR